MSNKYLYSSALISLIGIFLILLYGAYLLILDNNNPIVYPNIDMPARIVNDSIVVTVSYCRNSDLPFTSYVSFTNDIIYDMPSTVIAGSDLGCNTVNKVWKIPAELPSGTYHLVVKNDVVVNKLKTVSTGYRTTSFTINRTDVDID